MTYFQWKNALRCKCLALPELWLCPALVVEGGFSYASLHSMSVFPSDGNLST